MIKQTIIMVIDAIWLACLWAGLYMGVDGALNIGLFMAWLMAICSFMLISKEIGDDVMKNKREWQIWRSGIFDAAGVVMLVWAGWWITGIAVFWALMANTGAWLSFKKRQQEAA